MSENVTPPRAWEPLYPMRPDGTIVVLYRGNPWQAIADDPMRPDDAPTLEDALAAAATLDLPAEPLPSELPPPLPMRRIGALAFRRRLGPARATITAVAAQDLSADPPVPDLQVMLDDINAASWVDLDDPAIVAGLNFLVARRLITVDDLPRLLADGQPGEEPA